MIENKIADISNERAAELASKGLFVRAKAATPLLELVKFTTPFTLQTETGLQFYRNASDNDGHNSRQEETAQFVADRVSEHVSYFRNTVAAAVDRIITALTEEVKNISVSPFSGYVIVERGLPPLLALTDFTDLLAKYDLGSSVMPEGKFRYPGYDNTQIIEAMHTGNSNVDAIIDAWVTKLPEGALQTVWQSIFQDLSAEQASVRRIQSTAELLQDPVFGATNAVIITLLCNRLSDDIGTDCGLELGQARDLFFALRQASASAIKTAVERYNSFGNTKTMVFGFSRQNKAVEVHKEIYNEWLAAGGSAEILFGLLVLAKEVFSVAEIDVLKEEALKAWSYHIKVHGAEQNLEFTNSLRSLAILIFDKDLDENKDESETNALAAIPNTVSIKEKFISELACATSDQIYKNWFDVVWRAVVRARFFYTDAEKFLGDINLQVSQDGVTQTDAATLATINYIARYMAEMTEITH